MRLAKAQVLNYRSIRDIEPFEVEGRKAIFVGPNEAGKTAILRALQQLNPPTGVAGFDALRDYPRSQYNDITTGKVKPEDAEVVRGWFTLEDGDRADLPSEFHSVTYVYWKTLGNKTYHELEGGPARPTYDAVKKDLLRLAAHIDARVPPVAEGAAKVPTPSEQLTALTSKYHGGQLSTDQAKALLEWLAKHSAMIDEGNSVEEERHERLERALKILASYDEVVGKLHKRRPKFVLYANYFRVKPLLHLEHLANRTEQKLLDDEQYDYGNLCLLRLLGFTPRELSTLGKAPDPAATDPAALQTYRDQLDKRAYQLNAASVRLTDEIKQIWNPNLAKDEANRLRITADGQYLKVVVEDDLGVEIELDQRSEGFQWLVSFFVVFFAEAMGEHRNAILLLDEPGMSLHALKQREFRQTISRLSECNQTLFTTHSPFLVGPDELDLVRVVEMENRKVGTKVHTTVAASDSAALLPLQEALGYDLAQSLFSGQRNLVVEGLTDFWYVECVAGLLRDAGLTSMNEKISLVPAGNAGKVVYYATILHAHKLKVAALLDSDAAGDQAAKQETLVAALGNKSILRTRDAYQGPVKTPEVEDLLRATLVPLASKTFGKDISAIASQQGGRPLVSLLEEHLPDFSKYKLAKAFIRWAREHSATDLAQNEREDWSRLFGKVNSVLK